MAAPRDFPDPLKTAPFTTATAIQAGVSTSMLRGSRVRRLWRGVYAWHELQLTGPVMAQAARLILPPEAVAARLTAAEQLGAEVPWSPPPHFWLPLTYAGRSINGVRLHRYEVRPPTRSVLGVPVTDPARTFVDLAAELDLRQLVAVGDSLVRRTDLTLVELRAATSVEGRRHVRAARQASRLVRDKVDSPRESDLRLLLTLAGLPRPEVNLDVFDAYQWLARPDLSYPSCRIAIEYDGRHHWRTSSQRERDIRRVEDLSRGWLVIVVTHEQLSHDPYGVLRRVFMALSERGHAGTPPRLARAWRPYFRATYE